MRKKVYLLIITFFILAIISSDISALSISEISNFMEKGEYKKALLSLDNSDISEQPDLQYYQALILSRLGEYEKAEAVLKNLISKYPARLDAYDQLARIYGWAGKFSQAEKIISEAQNKEISVSRYVILARHAEWQNKWYQARFYWQQAINLTHNNDLKYNYKQSLSRVEEYLKTKKIIEISLENTDLIDSNLLFGLEKLVKDGINLNTMMDIQMPEMDGYQALKKIKELKKSDQKLNIIALTAYALESDRKKAIESGFIDHISKPIKKKDLLEIIEKYI